LWDQYLNVLFFIFPLWNRNRGIFVSSHCPMNHFRFAKGKFKFFLMVLSGMNSKIKFVCDIAKVMIVNEIWKQGVCDTVALPFTLKSNLRQKKNYGNSNISPCKNIIFKKFSKRNQTPSIDYNSTTNLKFQHKPKYHLSKILIWK
jgi:hypothetical protein